MIFTVKTEAAWASETFVFHRISTWRHNPDDHDLKNCNALTENRIPDIYAVNTSFHWGHVANRTDIKVQNPCFTRVLEKMSGF